MADDWPATGGRPAGDDYPENHNAMSAVVVYDTLTAGSRAHLMPRFRFHLKHLGQDEGAPSWSALPRRPSDGRQRTITDDA